MGIMNLVAPIVILTFSIIKSAQGEYVCYIEEVMKKVVTENKFFTNLSMYRGECEVIYRGNNHKKYFMCPNGTKLLKPKCVCGYFRFQDDKITACDNPKDDDPNHMTCGVCREKSDNGTGPCQNGGFVVCKNYSDTAADLECKCPENYSGKYCEIYIYKVKRQCQVAENTTGYSNCTNSGKKPCITPGENGGQSFICSNKEVADTDVSVLCSDYSVTINNPYKISGPVSRGICLEVSILPLFLLEIREQKQKVSPDFVSNGITVYSENVQENVYTIQSDDGQLQTINRRDVKLTSKDKKDDSDSDSDSDDEKCQRLPRSATKNSNSVIQESIWDNCTEHFA